MAHRGHIEGRPLHYNFRPSAPGIGLELGFLGMSFNFPTPSVIEVPNNVLLTAG